MNALVVVDAQNDFLPGGALAVPRGDEIIPLVNQLQKQFELVVATQDWHPRNHGSFAANHPGKKPGDRIMLEGIEQILWPIHCVQNTTGAKFAADLATERFARMFQKGIDPKIDSYSTFFDNAHRRATGLGDYLKQRSVTDVYLCGLATDYCVKYSALDARQLGFNAHVIVDACRGINLAPGDVDLALKEMRASGACVLQSGDVRDKRA
ncbi:MAG TPA: bifunctional nicotinamidase/pyrazinamidase [Chthoniobacterales bacterium]|jgi:nicotinamidase/pyrazinamidase